MRRFRNRTEAGRELAGALGEYANRSDVVVLGLARGGFVVAYEIAKILHVALDVYVVRKLGVPGNEELAMGAIAGHGIRVLNAKIVAALGIGPDDIDKISRTQQVELERREQLYLQGRDHPSLTGKVVVLVDDGLATGSTMRAAIAVVRDQGPQRVVVAVPVCARSAGQGVRALADGLVRLCEPVSFSALSQWYEDFEQVGDGDVQHLISQLVVKSDFG
jgi:putative phosphoribosyl transferase